ncbi:MAG: TlyA family RNA methyltransferase [Fusobacteria bacterium]|nr:TlyA family RNA methyltransferase [Fusobacteriota bacterium]
MKERLDILLVKKGLFETREKAKSAIMAGIIVVDDKKIDKAGTLIKEESNIRIKGETLKYVSRGGLKLEKAIVDFNIDFNNRRVLDIGASTGGFTDCALQNGASYVYSVDVGTNQLNWKLRENNKVKSIENMHIKNLELDDLDNEKVDIIVIDVSFISLTKIILYFEKFLNESGNIITLIKPQFEVGKENITKGGIVKDEKEHLRAIEVVINNAKEHKYYLNNLIKSPITGVKGNIEYLALFSRVENNFKLDRELI